MLATRREQLRSAFGIVSPPANACPQAPLVAFEEALQRWARQHCVLRERCWGGAGGLHLDYVRWCEQGAAEVPCSLAQFKEWLSAEGFRLHGLGLVYGLVLQVDVVVLS